MPSDGDGLNSEVRDRVGINPLAIAIGLSVFGTIIIAVFTVLLMFEGQIDIQDRDTFKKSIWFASSIGFAIIASGVTATFPSSTQKLTIKTAAITVSGSAAVFFLVLWFSYDRYTERENPVDSINKKISDISPKINEIHKNFMESHNNRENRISGYLETIRTDMSNTIKEASTSWAHNWKFIPHLEVKIACIGPGMLPTEYKQFYYSKDMDVPTETVSSYKFPLKEPRSTEGFFWSINRSTLSSDTASGYIKFDFQGGSTPLLTVAINSQRTEDLESFCKQQLLPSSISEVRNPDPNAAPNTE
jgi:hypothetical protein